MEVTEEFTAFVEERYWWECPYCDEFNDDMFNDPEGELRECVHCKKDSKCTSTIR